MDKTSITWNDLADHINSMSEEERNSPVLVWGESINICKEVCIIVEHEDMCCIDGDADECFLRSDYDGDDESEIQIVLEAGKTHLFI